MNDPQRNAICGRVRDAIQRTGLSYREVGDMLVPPVTEKTVYNYTSFRPPFRYLRQLGELCGVPYEWLLDGGDMNGYGADGLGGAGELREVVEQLHEEVRDEAAQLARVEAKLEDVARLVEALLLAQQPDLPILPALKAVRPGR